MLGGFVVDVATLTPGWSAGLQQGLRAAARCVCEHRFRDLDAEFDDLAVGGDAAGEAAGEAESEDKGYSDADAEAWGRPPQVAWFALVNEEAAAGAKDAAEAALNADGRVAAGETEEKNEVAIEDDGEASEDESEGEDDYAETLAGDSVLVWAAAEADAAVAAAFGFAAPPKQHTQAPNARGGDAEPSTKSAEAAPSAPPAAPISATATQAVPAEVAAAAAALPTRRRRAMPAVQFKAAKTASAARNSVHATDAVTSRPTPPLRPALPRLLSCAGVNPLRAAATANALAQKAAAGSATAGTGDCEPEAGEGADGDGAEAESAAWVNALVPAKLTCTWATLPTFQLGHTDFGGVRISMRSETSCAFALLFSLPLSFVKCCFWTRGKFFLRSKLVVGPLSRSHVDPVWPSLALFHSPQEQHVAQLILAPLHPTETLAVLAALRLVVAAYATLVDATLEAHNFDLAAAAAADLAADPVPLTRGVPGSSIEVSTSIISSSNNRAAVSAAASAVEQEATRALAEAMGAYMVAMHGALGDADYKMFLRPPPNTAEE
jgi:hypothetical protein